MPRSASLAVLALVAPFALAGCGLVRDAMEAVPVDRVVGSGTIVDEDRQVGPFEEIEAESAIEITAVIGQDQSVTVSGDDNIVPIVETSVSGGRLTVGYPPNTVVQPSQEVVVRIVAPGLTYIGASGASGVSVTGLKVDKLELQASGASRITAAGAGSTLTIGASGASRVEAESIPAWEADVKVSGASTVMLDVSDRLKGDASGASRVCYVTEPAELSVTTSGASSVLQCD